MMGIESQKSSTPQVIRTKIKEALQIIMKGGENELNDFLTSYREEFKKLSPEVIAFPRSCNGLKKFASDSSIYSKGCPIHVKGALLYNHLLKEKGLARKFQSVMEGDKIKFVELKQPNPLGCNVISFMGNLPTELNITQYIDYDSQYEKSFIDPLSFITNVIGWHLDRSFGSQLSLENFFN